MQGTVVCGITDSAESRAAAQLAEALAARLTLRLVLVHVVDRRRDDLLDGASLETLAPDAELRIVHGNRVDALARVSADEGADMIILGSTAHGRSLRCPLARELEAAQPVPVLVAPPATRPRSARRLRLAETAARR